TTKCGLGNTEPQNVDLGIPHYKMWTWGYHTTKCGLGDTAPLNVDLGIQLGSGQLNQNHTCVQIQLTNFSAHLPAQLFSTSYQLITAQSARQMTSDNFVY
ncbi:unnamed protein product, partial [Owenia fusiformis]